MGLTLIPSGVSTVSDSTDTPGLRSSVASACHFSGMLDAARTQPLARVVSGPPSGRPRAQTTRSISYLRAARTRESLLQSQVVDNWESCNVS